MQKNYNERVIFKVSPCKLPDPCRDYDDYDPCESNDDITEKDLAVLLKEEQAKLQREKEAAEAELRKQQGDKDGTNADRRKRQEQLQGSGKSSDREGLEGREKPCRRAKKLCRKLSIQNPFFRNRLSFSSDLPPPPPVPPPQFLPLVDESDSKPRICQKRKKKCKKKVVVEEEVEEENEDDGNKEESDGECHCLDESDGEEEFVQVKKGKRRCKKPIRFPCRKKESDVFISLQPRKIPAVQRDLPPTHPQDIPEVERQILMSREEDRGLDCFKKTCKKKS